MPVYPLNHPWLLPFSRIPISQQTLLASPPKRTRDHLTSPRWTSPSLTIWPCSPPPPPLVSLHVTTRDLSHSVRHTRALSVLLTAPQWSSTSPRRELGPTADLADLPEPSSLSIFSARSCTGHPSTFHLTFTAALEWTLISFYR